MVGLTERMVVEDCDVEGGIVVDWAVEERAVVEVLTVAFSD